MTQSQREVAGVSVDSWAYGHVGDPANKFPDSSLAEWSSEVVVQGNHRALATFYYLQAYINSHLWRKL